MQLKESYEARDEGTRAIESPINLKAFTGSEEKDGLAPPRPRTQLEQSYEDRDEGIRAIEDPTHLKAC